MKNQCKNEALTNRVFKEEKDKKIFATVRTRPKSLV